MVVMKNILNIIFILLLQGKIKNSDSAKESKSETDYLENVAVMDESTLMEEEQLGLKQAEERLERDYIIRLEKVSTEFNLCIYVHARLYI